MDICVFVLVLFFPSRTLIDKDVYPERQLRVVMVLMGFDCHVCVSLCNAMQFFQCKTWLCLCSVGALFYVIPLYLF